jgi:hypothetical protein
MLARVASSRFVVGMRALPTSFGVVGVFGGDDRRRLRRNPPAGAPSKAPQDVPPKIRTVSRQLAQSGTGLPPSFGVVGVFGGMIFGVFAGIPLQARH